MRLENNESAFVKHLHDQTSGLWDMYFCAALTGVLSSIMPSSKVEQDEAVVLASEIATKALNTRHIISPIPGYTLPYTPNGVGLNPNPTQDGSSLTQNPFLL